LKDRGAPDRRRVQRGGRRASDLRALTPELRDEATEYITEVERCLGVLSEALDRGDVPAAREASKGLKRAADALQLLLATGQSMKRE
jgi:hypothetical protein